jgi:phosphatidylcholine synthase
VNIISAWLVHLYTASGAVAAFLGVLAVFDGRFRDAFLWMAAATFVDATDGWLARQARVKDRIPQIDGGRLDDIVDYLTFVFLPMLLLYRSGVLPPGWGVPVSSVVLLSSAYGFARADAKAADHFFTGFPSYWNVVALYLFVAALPPSVNALVLLAFSALVFVPIGYVYPSRTPALRRLTLGLGVIWGVLVLAMILTLPEVPRLLFLASLIFPFYYFALSLVLHQRRGC